MIIKFEKAPISSLGRQGELDNPEGSTREMLIYNMASCHSLTRIGGLFDLVGDTMEIKMFKATQMVFSIFSAIFIFFKWIEFELPRGLTIFQCIY